MFFVILIRRWKFNRFFRDVHAILNVKVSAIGISILAVTLLSNLNYLVSLGISVLAWGCSEGDFIAGCVPIITVVCQVGKRFPEFFKSSYHFILFIIIALFSTRGHYHLSMSGTMTIYPHSRKCLTADTSISRCAVYLQKSAIRVWVFMFTHPLRSQNLVGTSGTISRCMPDGYGVFYGNSHKCQEQWQFIHIALEVDGDNTSHISICVSSKSAIRVWSIYVRDILRDEHWVMRQSRDSANISFGKYIWCGILCFWLIN